MRSTRCTVADLNRTFNYYINSMQKAPVNPTLRKLIRPNLIQAYNSSSHEQFWSCLKGVIAQLRQLESHNAELACKASKRQELRDALTSSTPRPYQTDSKKERSQDQAVLSLYTGPIPELAKEAERNLHLELHMKGYYIHNDDGICLLCSIDFINRVKRTDFVRSAAVVVGQTLAIEGPATQFLQMTFLQKYLQFLTSGISAQTRFICILFPGFDPHFHVHNCFYLLFSIILYFFTMRSMRSTFCSQSQANLSDIYINSLAMIGRPSHSQEAYLRMNLNTAYSLTTPKQFWKDLETVENQLHELQIAKAKSQLAAENIEEIRYIIANKRTAVKEEFSFGEKIAEGTFGCIWMARHIATGMNLAIKEIDIGSMEYYYKQKPKGYAQKRLQSEIEIGSLRYHHLLQTYGAFTAQNRAYIVMERMGSTLDKVIIKLGDKRVPKHVVAKILYDVCQAIDFLHKRNIIHRDIKPQNIFLSESGLWKLGDFGLSSKVEDISYTTCGTPFYMPPEIYKKKEYSKEIDIWSLGVLAYELLIADKPFTSTFEVNRIIMNQSLRRIPEVEIQQPNHLPEDIFEFLKNSLQHEPHLRWTSEQMLNSKLIASRSNRPYFAE